MPVSNPEAIENENAYAVFENEISMQTGVGGAGEMAPVPKPVTKLTPYFVSIEKRADVDRVIKNEFELNKTYFIEKNELDFLQTTLKYWKSDDEDTSNGEAVFDGPAKFFIYSELSGDEIKSRLTGIKIIRTGQKIAAELNFADEASIIGPDFKISPQNSEMDRIVWPMSAVIDDGIGFLNSRFCVLDENNARKTRIQGIWLQSGETFTQGKDDAINIGEQLFKEEIDKQLAEIEQGKKREGDIYRRIARGLQKEDGQSQLANARSHGTHVLDLFSGYEPAEVTDPPLPEIFAVQLQPRAVRQSNGSLFEQSFLQALNWILSSALEHAIKMRDDFEVIEDNPNIISYGKFIFPIVVNASFGILAGSKTGNDFLTTQIQAYAERYEILTKLILGAPSPVRIVFPYGNSYESRQVALVELTGEDQPKELVWDLLPDDLSPSYLEIRPSEDTEFNLTLISPDGTKFEILSKDLPQQGFAKKFAIASLDAPVGQIFGLEEDGRTWYLVALSPTRKSGSDANTWSAAPCGAWTVVLGNAETPKPGSISFQIQRDDTPGAYRLLGRQSRFGSTAKRRFDYQAGRHSQLWYFEDQEQELVTPEGTHSARLPGSSDAENRGILYGVGAAVKTGNSNEKAASYSSMGSKKTALTQSEGPDVSAYASMTPQGLGRIAAGTQSGSVGFSHGTSVSAPLVARQLLAALSKQLKDENNDPDDFVQPVTPEIAASELKMVLKPKNTRKNRDPRLGHGVVELDDVGAIGVLSRRRHRGHG